MLLCSRDARFFELAMLWAQTRMPGLAGEPRAWKGNSYSPLDTRSAERATAAGAPHPRLTCNAMKHGTNQRPVFPKRDALLRREFLISSQIPYTAQVSEHVVRTKWGDYVQVFRLAGASFESADDEQLNNWHERLAIAWRNIASPNVALWTHVIRRRERTYPAARSSRVRRGAQRALQSAHQRRATDGQ